MPSPDGIIRPEDRPALPVVFFGQIDDDIRNAILCSLEGFLASLGDRLRMLPRLQVESMTDPGITGGRNASRTYFSDLDSVRGGIVLGVTRNGLWDENPHPRFVFGTGFCGTAIFSLHRFLNDSPGRALALTRIEKEVPKIIALACGVPSCSDPACCLVYHWTVEDVDRNTGVCGECRGKLAEAIDEYLG
jgi:predicted Zn-dependent protease